MYNIRLAVDGGVREDDLGTDDEGVVQSASVAGGDGGQVLGLVSSLSS